MFDHIDERGEGAQLKKLHLSSIPQDRNESRSSCLQTGTSKNFHSNQKNFKHSSRQDESRSCYLRKLPRTSKLELEADLADSQNFHSNQQLQTLIKTEEKVDHANYRCL